MKEHETATHKAKRTHSTVLEPGRISAFWETHDVADYWHDFDKVVIDFQLEKPKEENIVVRVQRPIKERLAQIARRKGLNISSLTRMWIMEKLQNN